MLQNGVYEVVYATHVGQGRAVITLVDGVMAGMDFLGGEYDGTVEYDPIRKVGRLAARIVMPAATRAVTGFYTGDQPETFNVTAWIPTPNPKSRFSLELAGRAVDAEIRLVRALPGGAVEAE